MCTTPGAGAGERNRPAPEQLPSWRGGLWKPWQRVPRIETWTGDYPQTPRIMENVKELFWCDARDEQGHLQHAPDCEQRDCLVVQGKKQETNTGAKAKKPDHYRCTYHLCLLWEKKALRG